LNQNRGRGGGPHLKAMGWDVRKGSGFTKPGSTLKKSLKEKQKKKKLFKKGGEECILKRT